jgi:hypothetical protein
MGIIDRGRGTFKVGAFHLSSSTRVIISRDIRGLILVRTK